MHEVLDNLFQRRMIIIFIIIMLKVCNLINWWLNAIIRSQGRLILLQILLLYFLSLVIRLLLLLSTDQDRAIIVCV